MAEITLPSKGIFYEGELSSGVVHIRDMSTAEEKQLGGRGNKDVASLLIKSCVTSPKISDPLQLLVSDRNFLMLMIRTETYGPEYSFVLTCEEPSCRKKIHETKRIPHDFDVRVFEGDETEPFEVVLPRSNKTVGLRLLRGFDETEVERYREQQYNRGFRAKDGDPALEYRYARQIKTIDGEEVNVQQALDLFPMSSMDTTVMIRALQKNDCGLDGTWTVECPYCGHVFTATLPVTEEFFRPNI